jgi:hypothetical protein
MCHKSTTFNPPRGGKKETFMAQNMIILLILYNKPHFI